MLVKDYSNIKIVLSDIDGVLTDGGMYYTENGDEMKKFCVYDGMGFKLLQERGYKVGLITSEDRKLNERRAKKLKVDFIYQGNNRNKLDTIKELCEKEGVDMKDVAYIGDDINCFDLLSNVGLAACPANAMPGIKSIPGIIRLTRNGGEGVFREFVWLILGEEI